MSLFRCNELLRVKSLYKCCCNRCSNQRLSDFPTTFQSKEAQHGWYDVWEKNKYFVPTHNEKETLKMILPPPNITGILHLGHALTVTVQDVLARWQKMKGHPVIWIPGLDHAGIATQTIVEKYLLKTKGITKEEMGREEFLSYIWQWKEQKEDVIKNQLKTLGASLDWSREYFTLSKEHNFAVKEALMILNDRNLLYRKKDMVNWCPFLRSTISDIEVQHLYLSKRTQLDVPGYVKKVTFGQIMHIAYRIKDSKDEIIVATTRPETIFGDVAIAVHPDDERYAKYIGQQVWHDMRETHIPVIADSSVDKEFGTGAVKITPAHDQLDFIIAKNHDLEIIQVIDECGNITEAGNELKGLPRFIARERILDILSNKGLLRAVADHTMSIPRCSRSNDIIEHILKEQWFVKCEGMAQRAVEAVRDGNLKLNPATHEHVWYEWLQDIRDWCISRQLWWGHRMPAYSVTIGDKTEWIIARSKSDAELIAREKYGSNLTVQQCTDVLDTWFSSAILPFSAMGWLNKPEDFQRYYPLTLMETGHDILFFWVARMVMLGLELTNQLPFKEVLLHGILCDGNGKKMSKSIGNVISPENIINGISLEDLIAQTKESHSTDAVHKNELKRTIAANKKMFPNGIVECGVDALRMTLCSLNIKNKTINFDVQDCKTNKLFCNKIWQVSKYVLLMTDEKPLNNPRCLTFVDRWILSRLSLLVKTVDRAFTERDFHKAVASIKQFFYYEFCDFYVETTKQGFKSDDVNVIESHKYTLIKCLEVSLRILAPIMPYLVEDLYKRLSNKLPEFLALPSILEASYPMPAEFEHWSNTDLDDKINDIIEVILEIRRLTADISSKSKPQVHIVMNDCEDYNFYKDNVNLLIAGIKTQNVSIRADSDYTPPENSISHTLTPDCSLFFITEEPSTIEQVNKNITKKISKMNMKKDVRHEVTKGRM